eukprot:SAG31_NODE_13584_length_859_cov_1.150000_1_plen_181_part_01
MPRRQPKPRALVWLQELLEFCIPEGQVHPRTATRLYMIGLYGPLKDGWLWGGPYNARRKLSEYEIMTMMNAVEREDLLACCAPIVIKGLPESVKKPYQLSKPDIVKICAPCATYPDPEPKTPRLDPRVAQINAFLLPELSKTLAALASGEEVDQVSATEVLGAWMTPPEDTEAASTEGLNA